MKDFYRNNTDKIWCFLCALSILLGVFVDVAYGLIVILLIAAHFYVNLESDVDGNFTEFDRFGVSFTALLLHLLGYLAIIALVSSFVHKNEIKTTATYDVKYLENEKILILKDNNLAIIDDAKLYWECRAKNCKRISITDITTEPINNIYSRNLTSKSSTIYSVGSVESVKSSD